MGPEFWEQWSRDIRGAHRMILLVCLQVMPPLFAVTGGVLAISAILDPRTPDRANMIAVGVLVFLAGSVATALLLYVRRLLDRMRPPKE